MILKGKVAVVTGASDGIGKQVALKLADQEVSLALMARTAEKLKQTKTKLYTFDKLHKEWMKNPEFRREYKKLGPEFRKIRQDLAIGKLVVSK